MVVIDGDDCKDDIDNLVILPFPLVLALVLALVFVFVLEVRGICSNVELLESYVVILFLCKVLSGLGIVIIFFFVINSYYTQLYIIGKTRIKLIIIQW